MTPFSTVIGMSLITIQDYKLNKLYINSVDDWETYLSGFLILAIPDFQNSKIVLSYDETTKTFDNTLGLQEIGILASMVVYNWFTREINNVTQFENKMSSKDYHTFSENQNLKEKVSYQNKQREIIYQKMVDYGLNKNDWWGWANGNFGLKQNP